MSRFGQPAWNSIVRIGFGLALLLAVGLAIAAPAAAQDETPVVDIGAPPVMPGVPVEIQTPEPATVIGDSVFTTAGEPAAGEQPVQSAPLSAINQLPNTGGDPGSSPDLPAFSLVAAALTAGFGVFVAVKIRRDRHHA